MTNYRKISNDIYWVGASDRRLALFENIHPIPRGVSYNSYLLKDEKNVVFDAVDWSVCRTFIENVEAILDGDPLNYIVVNHMEPDHGASLEELMIHWPEAQIIASAKAIQMMKQFGFHVEDKTIAVKENDTMCFGKHTVSFVMAPMVHWPEVMVTYDQTEGILFSADAFGTFGALDGVLFNDEVDFDKDWLEDARRYYTNIVGKYGPQVLNLLKKAASLDIKIIAPLHGPVWRSDLDYLLSKYQMWASYTPEEKGVLIVYASMYGNTEQAAQILASKLIANGVRKVAVYDVSKTHVSYLVSESFKYSHIVFASVTYNLEIYPVMLDFMMHLKMLNLNKRTGAIVYNGSWAPAAGKAMREFLTTSLKNWTVLDKEVKITSALDDVSNIQIKELAKAIAEDMNQ